MKKTNIQSPIEGLEYIKCIAWVAPDQLKALAFSSDTTGRRSVVEQELLKPYWKLQKG